MTLLKGYAAQLKVCVALPCRPWDSSFNVIKDTNFSQASGSCIAMSARTTLFLGSILGKREDI